MIRNTHDAWGSLAKCLHWTVALLVLAQFALGWAAVSWRLSPFKLDLFVWHKSIGVVILVLMVLRVTWRLANPVPDLPDAIAPWERRAARLGHILLYAMLFAMPLSGWVVNSAANIPFRIFWQVPLPGIVEPDQALARLAARVHLALFIGLSLLLMLHVGAALRHHLLWRNGVLTRMMPHVRVRA